MKPKHQATQETMKILRGYRYELKPNNRQRTLLAKHAGCARFTYNWGLEQRIKRFHSQEGKDRFTNAEEQHRELVHQKRIEFPWMYEVSKCAPQEALRDLDKAFANFWRRRKKNLEVGFPKFKKKGQNDSFRLYGSIRLFEKAVQLPRLGRLRLKEVTNVRGRILSATVSRKADRWFVSFNVEQEHFTKPRIIGSKIGVDVGITSLATLSDGIMFDNPQGLPRKLRKLRRLSRQVSRKQKRSRNRQKAVIKLARLHWRISNVRKDALHKLTTYLAKNHSHIVIEDLCVKGLMKNQQLNRAIADVSFYEIRRQLEYKTKWYGSELIIAPRYFPSSKLCSRCGQTKDNLSLSERVFICESCGWQIDRDLNAAINLVAASWAETENACLEVGGCRPTTGRCPSMMQELNTG
ncbi:MAG: RNA-guided endonuclease InsQ/TnpB family protein [Promethearchaeota archaeon]